MKDFQLKLNLSLLLGLLIITFLSWTGYKDSDVFKNKMLKSYQFELDAPEISTVVPVGTVFLGCDFSGDKVLLHTSFVPNDYDETEERLLLFLQNGSKLNDKAKLKLIDIIVKDIEKGELFYVFEVLE